MRFIRRLLLLLLAGWSLLHMLLRPRRNPQPVVIGHRGAAGIAPENTLAALRAGIAAGAELVEIDVQRSKDDVLVVFHDDTLERLTNGQGSVSSKSFDELRALDAGTHFGARYSDEKIPTLDEALQLARDSRVKLVIEMKSPAQFPGIAQQLALALKDVNAYRGVVVISFDHEWLWQFKRLMPDVAVGYIWMARGGEPRIGLSGEYADVYWWNVLLDPSLVRRMNSRGFKVWVWTVDRPLVMRLMRWLGVEGITTNRPDLAQF